MTTWGKPDGPEDARLLVVGRDYGFHEASKSPPRPFVGPAGFYLNRALLEEAGLPRSLVRVTNVCNTRPAPVRLGGKMEQDKWEGHDGAAVVRGTAELMQELRRFADSGGTLVLALGEQAFQACTTGDPNTRPKKKETITQTRGYLFPGVAGTPTLAAVHPAAFLHGSWLPDYPVFRRDIAKAGRYLRGERPGPRHEVICRTVEELQPHLEAALAAPAIGLDIEEDRVLAFSYDHTFGVAVPHYTQEPWRNSVQRLLEHSRFITMNGSYDTTRLQEYGFYFCHWAGDVMLKWHALEPLIAGKKENGGSNRTEKSLRFLISLLTWNSFHKDYDFQGADDEAVLCCKDAANTLEIDRALS